MAAWAEVLRDGPIGRKEALSVAWGLEPLHLLLPLTGRLVGVLSAIIEIPVLTMFHARKNLSFRGLVALEFVGDDDTRDVG
jgi:hypothetical protein